VNVADRLRRYILLSRLQPEATKSAKMAALKNISRAVRDTSDTSRDQRSVSPDNVHPRVYWSLRPHQASNSWQLNDLLRELRRNRSQAVCIIEGLERHSHWLREITQQLDLVDFLEAHTSRYWSITQRRPWHWAIGDSSPDRQQLYEEDQVWRCIEGFYSVSNSPKTRISYLRLHRYVCKFTRCFVGVDRLMRPRLVSSQPSSCCSFKSACFKWR
jgi:hypothetical protein